MRRLLVLQEVEVLVVLDEGVVDLAGAQRGHDVGLVGDHAQHQLVDVGHALLEEVGMALEHHLLLHLPVDQHERPGAQRVLVEVAVLLDPGLADDEAPEAAERGEEPGERLLGRELHAVLAGGLHLVDGDEVRLPRRLLEEPVEGELDVGRGQFLAVVELHPLAQLERPHEPVLAHLPRLGQLRHRRHALVEADELAVHHRRATAPGQRGDELGIESRRLGGLGGDQGPAGLRRLGARRPRDREGAGGEAARLEQVAPGHRMGAALVVGRHRSASCGR